MGRDGVRREASGRVVARLLLVLVVLVAWNLSAAYAQRPWMPLLRHWVPVVDGLPARRALHRGIGFLYVLTATLGYWYLVPSVVVPYVLALYVLLVVSLRAALFEPVLQSGEPDTFGAGWANRRPTIWRAGGWLLALGGRLTGLGRGRTSWRPGSRWALWAGCGGCWCR